jgi:hypothetical protein
MKLPRVTATQLHFTLTWMWVVLLVPTLLLWSESVLWVAVMSLYANVAGHWSAYQAAHAEEKLLKKVQPDSKGSKK